MDWSLKQVADELLLRVREGPMQVRFVLQPTVAAALGILDGLADARAGMRAIVPALFSHNHNRRFSLAKLVHRLRWSILIASAIDAAVQYVMFGHVRPLSALLVGSMLMAVPYCSARSLSSFFRSRRRRRPRVQPV
jgi:hypothetical protein